MASLAVGTAPVRFRSALDSGIVVLMLISTAFPLLITLLEAHPLSLHTLWPVALVLGPGLGLPALLFAVTAYEFTDDALVVRVGPWRMRLPYADITEVTPSSDFTSAPAWSLDRLCITYGSGKQVLISPTPRDEFLEALNTCRGRTVSVRRAT